MAVRKVSRWIVCTLAALVFCSVYYFVLRNSIRGAWEILPIMAAMLGGYLLIHHFDLGRRAFWVCFAVMVVLQCFSMYFLKVIYSSWDVFAVTKNADALVKGEWFNARYFARYPNNIAMLLITTAVYGVTYHLFHFTSLYFMLMVNIFVIDLAILISVRIMRTLMPERAAWRGGILMTLFLPYYLYVPISYTDTFVMPFIVGIIDLSLSAARQWDQLRPRRRVLRCCLIGALCLIAFRIKGSAIVLLIACGMYFFFRFRLKAFLQSAACLLAGFLVALTVWNAGISALNLIPDEYYYEEQFPVTHWIMMGLKGHGQWNSEDVNGFTMTFSNYDERSAAVNAELKRRLDALGPAGLIRQFYFKATTYAWNTGTCNAEQYLGDIADLPVRPNILHTFILSDGANRRPFYLVTQSYWLLLFGFAVSGFIALLRRGVARLPLLLTLALVGCMMFFMIWETHPRYVLHFTQVLIMIAAAQMEAFADLRRRVRIRLLRKSPPVSASEGGAS